MKDIKSTSSAKFRINTPSVVGSELQLDFNPIIEAKELTGDYLIIHWQAKPKGDREWGIYSSAEDSYRSFLGGKVNGVDVELFQLDDKTATTIPSAVMIVKNSRVTCINGKAIIGEVYLSDMSA